MRWVVFFVEVFDEWVEVMGFCVKEFVLELVMGILFWLFYGDID